MAVPSQLLEHAAARLDALVDKDRKEYLASLSAQNSAYTL